MHYMFIALSAPKGLSTQITLRIRQVSRLMRKLSRGHEPSRTSPMASTYPLLIHGSGGCSGFEPDSLLIYSAYSISNRISYSVQVYYTSVSAQKQFQKSYRLSAHSRKNSIHYDKENGTIHHTAPQSRCAFCINYRHIFWVARSRRI